jgi:SOS-response transcriptional repressor LexA
MSDLNPLSGFERAVVQLYHAVQRECRRFPHLDEIACRLSLSEESVRHLICAVRRKGYSLFLLDEKESEQSHVWSRYIVPVNSNQIPLSGIVPAGFTEGCCGEQKAAETINVNLGFFGLPFSDDLFALEVSGDSMIGKGVQSHDFVLLDKRKRRANGSVVAALVDGEVTLKTLVREPGKSHLRAENPAYPDIYPAEQMEIQGVMIALLPRAVS